MFFFFKLNISHFRHIRDSQALWRKSNSVSLWTIQRLQLPLPVCEFGVPHHCQPFHKHFLLGCQTHCRPNGKCKWWGIFYLMLVNRSFKPNSRIQEQRCFSSGSFRTCPPRCQPCCSAASPSWRSTWRGTTCWRMHSGSRWSKRELNSWTPPTISKW